MTKEFITHNQALALKELGFDEPCFGFYPKSGGNIQFGSLGKFSSEYTHIISAPLYSQAFRWFRDKYKITHSIKWLDDVYGYYYLTTDMDSNTDSIESKGYPTYEEAEEYCLDKLIEIVKKT